MARVCQGSGHPRPGGTGAGRFVKGVARGEPFNRLQSYAKVEKTETATFAWGETPRLRRARNSN
jgi:hypothetical protein